jgi:hypothetical protein
METHSSAALKIAGRSGEGPPVHADRFFPLYEFAERIGPERVIYYAKKQTDYRPNENATRRAHLNNAHPSAAYDANSRKDEEGATNEGAIKQDGSCPRRQGENNAAELPEETAGSPDEG